jgi:hypothetical protein
MNAQAQPYQPLTSENAALEHNVVALAKAGKVLKLPIRKPTNIAGTRVIS